MAILTAEDYQRGTGLSYTGADLVALETMCVEVSEALAALCNPVLLEPLELTLWALDAPVAPVLLLPRPVRSLSAVYYNPTANGNSSLLTSADLLTANVDYLLELDDPRTQSSKAGKLLRLRQSVWGVTCRYPPGALAPALTPVPRSVFVSGSFGPASVNPIAQAAARAAVSLLYARRKTGAPLNSESWGGYSSSVSGQFTATAAVNSPDCLDVLRSGGLLPYHVG